MKHNRVMSDKIDIGDFVENINPECDHYKTCGTVISKTRLPRITDGKSGTNIPGWLIKYKCNDTGQTLWKTGEQLKKISNIHRKKQLTSSRKNLFKEWVIYDTNNKLLTEQKLNSTTMDKCKDFIKFCRRYLKLKQPIRIKFQKELTENITTGCFSPSTGDIYIYIKDRALIDVFRSIAHELVHQKQHEDKKLNSTSGETGSAHENQANSIAGVIMREYQQANRDIY